MAPSTEGESGSRADVLAGPMISVDVPTSLDQLVSAALQDSEYTLSRGNQLNGTDYRVNTGNSGFIFSEHQAPNMSIGNNLTFEDEWRDIYWTEPGFRESFGDVF